MGLQTAQSATNLQNLATLAVDVLMAAPIDMFSHMTNTSTRYECRPKTREVPVRQQRQKKLFIRIKKEIWNDYSRQTEGKWKGKRGVKPRLRLTLKPQSAGVKRSTKTRKRKTTKARGEAASPSRRAPSSQRQRLVLKLKLPTNPTSQALLTPRSTPTPATTLAKPFASCPEQHQIILPQPEKKDYVRACNIKTTRFIPGGPHRALRGQAMGDMYLEQPCLKVGCRSCAWWYPQLIEEPGTPLPALGSVRFGRLACGPQGLKTEDGYKREMKRGGTGACQGWAEEEEEVGRLRPVVEALNPPGALLTPPPAAEGDKVEMKEGTLRPMLTGRGRGEKSPSPFELPPSLLWKPEQPSLGLRCDAKPTKTARKFTSTPQPSKVVKLRLRIAKKKEIFARLVQRMEGPLKIEELTKSILKDVASTSLGEKRKRGIEKEGDEGAIKKRVRFRHRVKLTFESEVGKERFRQLVKKV